jgi:hypothetical protein
LVAPKKCSRLIEQALLDDPECNVSRQIPVTELSDILHNVSVIQKALATDLLLRIDNSSSQFWPSTTMIVLLQYILSISKSRVSVSRTQIRLKYSNFESSARGDQSVAGSRNSV